MACGIGGFGSLNNFMAANAVKGQPTPVVGMGVTLLSWTDRYPGTIVEVSKSGKSITIQEDFADRIDSNGMSECQDYTYRPNPDAPKVVYRLNKRGQWAHKGQKLRIGERERYYDFSF